MTCTLFCFDVRIAPNHRLSILLVLLSFFVVGQVIQTYGQDTKPVCVPRDYWLSSSTDCNETLHERTVVYSLRDASHDRCVGPQKIVIEGHTCECTLFEYEAIRQDDEENSLRIKDFIPIASGCVSNPPVAKILHDTIDDESWLPSVCGLEDIGSHYTECNSSTNMRLLVFYWKRLCRRTGTIALPSTTDLPCNAMCSDGQFLAPPFTECQTCPSGTYSITGTIYSYPWNDLPDGFHTDCFGSNCKVWYVQGDSLTVTGGSTARLRMWYDVIQFPAYLNVTYIGSRDLKDLNILINGEVTYPTKKSIPDPDWSLMSIDLSSQAEGECHIFLKIESEYDELQELCLARNDFVPGSSQTHLPPVQRMSEVEVVAASNLGCNARDFRSAVRGRVVVILRGKCRFDEKTRNAQAAGAIAVIHVDNGGATWSRLRITGDSAGLNIPILVTQVKDPHKIFSALHEKSVHMGSFARHVERLGRTEVEFIFTGSPADSFHIREISVKGTANAASQCRLCPPGFSSESGSAKCVPCPANTYADTWGTMWPCKNCPDHATSSQGSLVCTERSRCDISDVDVQLSSCALSSDGDFTRRLIYERRKPLSCDSSTWVAPDLKEVPCSQCPLGFQYDGTQCTGCPAGEYLDSRLGSCKKCGRGKYAQKVIRYEGFADLGGTLPPDWTVTCTFCTEPSWQFIPQSEENHARIHLMTGPHFGVLGYGKLSIPFQLEVTGRIAFAYHVGYDMHMSHAPKTVNISFSISDNRTHISKNIHRAPNGITQYETYALPAGEYKLEFTYMRIESDMTDVTLTLHSLNIEGIYEGSAHECVPCPSGVMCENGIPTPCAVGTYSRVGGHCEVCEENAIAPDIGTSSCRLCGEGTHADASHQTCFLDPYVILQSADGDIPVHFSLIDATSVTAPVPIKSVSGAKRTEHEGESVILHLRTAAKKEENDGGISPCEGASGDGPFACLLMPEESKKEPRVLGKSLLSVSMERDPRNIDNAVVKLQLGDGDICNREENIYYQTAVYLGCTPFSRTDQVGIPLQIIGWEGCSISVLMEAPSLCPLCTSFQTQEEIGECISGKRLVYRTKRQTCYDLQAKKVVVFGGDAPLELPCDLLDDLEAHAALVKTTVIICVIAFCFLIGIAAYLYISRKRMYGAYMKLAASAGDACSTPTALELEDVDEQEK